MEEYMANAYVSLALGPTVLPALYFVGPKLSEDILGNSELQHLFMLMSTCGRLLNDIQSCKVQNLHPFSLKQKRKKQTNNRPSYNIDNSALFAEGVRAREAKCCVIGRDSWRWYCY